MEFKNLPKVLGLDISTKTIGWALFDMTNKQLLELTHFTPKLKPKPDGKVEEHLLKATAFGEKLKELKGLGVVDVIIEEPLLTSNNLYTVGTLMTYNARKFAFPTLMRENDKGRKVLFGGLPKGCDKKKLIWDEVIKEEPGLVWQYTRNNTLKKECFDMADAYTCVKGYMSKEGIW